MEVWKKHVDEGERCPDCGHTENHNGDDGVTYCWFCARPLIDATGKRFPVEAPEHPLQYLDDELDFREMGGEYNDYR